MKIVHHKKIKKDLKKLPKIVKKWFLDVITELENAEYPDVPGERLESEGDPVFLPYKQRFSDYRIIYIYNKEKDEVVIVAVGHREKIYDKARRRIKGWFGRSVIILLILFLAIPLILR